MTPFARARVALHPIRHEWAICFEPRTNFTFTRFLRLPRQYDALVEHVIDRLAPAGIERPLEIVNIGCSIGAAPYTAASVILSRRPDITFSIRAFDINPAVITKAQSATYSRAEVFASGRLPVEFVQQTFEPGDDAFVVRPRIRERVTFGIADVLSSDLLQATGSADIVFCQNLLVNLPSRALRRALRNLLPLLRTPGVLLIDGMPLRRRARLTRAAGLQPVMCLIEEIHEDVRRLHGSAWPWHYWGVERFDRRHAHWEWRYATMFLRN